MGQQKYSSQRTRTQHTYEFFKERQNDPAWRDDFLRIQAIRRRNRLLKIGLSFLLLLAIFIIFKVNQTSITALISHKTNQTANQLNNNSATATTASSTTANNQQASTSTVITNYARYRAYSGNYENSTGSYSLNFAAGTLTTKQQLFHFDKVILHPDGSLIINVHENSDYTSGQTLYLSILFAPANKKIQRNWQTNAPITDSSDTAINRFSLAKSSDGGKTFNMAPAYAAFEQNSTTIFNEN